MKTTKTSRFIKIGMLVVIFVSAVVSLFLVFLGNDKDTILINTDKNSPIELSGGGGERIYLRFGAIYGYKDDLKKEYSVVAMVLHVTQKQLDNMIFFDTPEEAEKAGYKPAEDFAKNYNCVKQGKDLFDCLES